MAAMRNGWCNRHFGDDRWYAAVGAPRRDGRAMRVFYARSQELADRKAERDWDAQETGVVIGMDARPVDPALDCPACPACGSPCGTTDECARGWLRMPEREREINRRMLEQLEARRPGPAGEQLDLLGGES
jgi:hypothetical protein